MKKKNIMQTEVAIEDFSLILADSNSTTFYKVISRNHV